MSGRPGTGTGTSVLGNGGIRAPLIERAGFGEPFGQDRLDEWLREVAPSIELQRWYGHRPQRFGEFRRRYPVRVAGADLPARPDQHALVDLAVLAWRLLVDSAADDLGHDASSGRFRSGSTLLVCEFIAFWVRGWCGDRWVPW
ncbi:DUF488 family protein [Streptomyces sp. NPDC046759]|uniref:DUF488 family protein, N3 subclade n=1 Tax=Streptomyces sp. NPDC046759 TaxID=3155019 RepID=UPI0033E41BAC